MRVQKVVNEGPFTSLRYTLVVDFDLPTKYPRLSTHLSSPVTILYRHDLVRTKLFDSFKHMTKSKGLVLLILFRRTSY